MQSLGASGHLGEACTACTHAWPWLLRPGPRSMMRADACTNGGSHLVLLACGVSCLSWPSPTGINIRCSRWDSHTSSPQVRLKHGRRPFLPALCSCRHSSPSIHEDALEGHMTPYIRNGMPAQALASSDGHLCLHDGMTLQAVHTLTGAHTSVLKDFNAECRMQTYCFM